MVKKSRGSAGRFGARYGASLKHKVSQIEKRKRTKYTCPKCMKDKVKRVSSGIWQCTSCKTKFAGRAYELS